MRSTFFGRGLGCILCEVDLGRGRFSNGFSGGLIYESNVNTELSNPVAKPTSLELASSLGVCTILSSSMCSGSSWSCSSSVSGDERADTVDDFASSLGALDWNVRREIDELATLLMAVVVTDVTADDEVSARFLEKKLLPYRTPLTLT